MLLGFASKMVGLPGFEPGTSATPRQRATKLRYSPKLTLTLYRARFPGATHDLHRRRKRAVRINHGNQNRHLIIVSTTQRQVKDHDLPGYS